MSNLSTARENKLMPRLKINSEGAGNGEGGSLKARSLLALAATPPKDGTKRGREV